MLFLVSSSHHHHHHHPLTFSEILDARSFRRVLLAIAAPSSWNTSPVSLEIVSGYV